MELNLDRESRSFWKAWKSGTHSKILNEILESDEFHARAARDILASGNQLDLIRSIVRMTGRRIGQEAARKAGGTMVERDIYSDIGSAFSGLESGVADALADAIKAHKKVAGILRDAGDADEEEVRKFVNELAFEASRMTGRALGPLMGVSLDKILSFGKTLLKLIL